MSSFESLGLIKQLVKAVEDKGYQKPTPIQAKAIPAVLSGRDVIGGAQTGTGKTAAFALPILQAQYQKRTKDRSPRALIIAPTRELADQVEKFVYQYSKGLGVYSCALYGGVKMDPQIRLLRRGVGIVVATPGRLLDHAERGTIKLSKIETFVLDEADRMLDMGFLPDIKKIISLIPSKSQSLLFSATYSDEIRELSKSFLNNPEKIEVARRNTTADLVRQTVHPVEKSRKRELLVHMINDGDWDQVLVFARTRHGAEKLSKQLTKDGIQSVAIHGDKTQGHRTRSLERFKKGTVRVLVATDVASRGLDIKQLPRVVNYELPDVAEDYVHRIGRTGRAKEKGDAHSFVCKSESKKLSAVEDLLGKKINKVEIEGFEGELIQYRADKKKPRARKAPRRSNGRDRRNSRFDKKPSSRKEKPSRYRKSEEESGDEKYRSPKRTPKRGRKTPSRDFEKKDFKSKKKSPTKKERPNKRRKASNAEKVFDKKDSKPPKKARPNETTAERRKRKPKWSAAKKKAAKIKKAKEAKDNRSGRTKRRN
ncbi:MAG: DEAD/DEAH box helicase [Verrucomicrobiota bacterium]|nr:DEAD/DEAH box helicase [Verrucomicrobiota bacterium]